MENFLFETIIKVLVTIKEKRQINPPLMKSVSTILTQTQFKEVLTDYRISTATPKIMTTMRNQESILMVKSKINSQFTQTLQTQQRSNQMKI